MIRVLVLIAVAGFFVSVISLGGAAALGGYNLQKSGWSFPITWDWEADEGGREIDWSGPDTTRTVDWEGAEDLNLVLPAEVTFTQGATPSLVISGPRDAVDAVMVNGGDITLRGRTRAKVSMSGLDVDVEGLDNLRRLKVVIVAPNVRSISASAATNLTVNGVQREDFELRARAGSDVTAHVDVDRLDLEVSSAADAVVDGRADRLEIEVHSGGDARLDKLAVNDATIEAHSGAEATLAPRNSADVEVHSGADVRLLSRPTDLRTDIHSGGDIHVEDGPPPAAPAPAKPATPEPPAPPAKPEPPKTT